MAPLQFLSGYTMVVEMQVSADQIVGFSKRFRLVPIHTLCFRIEKKLSAIASIKKPLYSLSMCLFLFPHNNTPYVVIILHRGYCGLLSSFTCSAQNIKYLIALSAIRSLFYFFCSDLPEAFSAPLPLSLRRQY